MSEWTVDAARRDMMGNAPGGRGAVFLICFGATVLLCGIAAFFLNLGLVVFLFICQGGVALPAAIIWERMRGARGDPDNPLWPLVYQILGVQIVALPAVFIIFLLDPRFVPAALGAIGGAHFLPFAWLYRTGIYIYLGVAISVIPFSCAVFMGHWTLPWVLVGWALAYWLAALLLWREPLSQGKRE